MLSFVSEISITNLLYCTRWVDALFCLGCCRSLNHSDLYAHPSEADSKKLQRKFERYVFHFNKQVDPIKAVGTMFYFCRDF